jgi:hypothetical protein
VTNAGFFKILAAVLVAGAGALVLQGDVTRAGWVASLAVIAWLASFVPEEDTE